MKKPILTILLAFVCISYMNAQNANSSKKAMLMGDGATVTDLKTGEVQRTTNSSISISEVPVNGTLTIITNNANTTPVGNAPVNAKPSNSTLQLSNKNGLTNQVGTMQGCNKSELQVKEATSIEKKKSAPAALKTNSALKAKTNGETIQLTPNHKTKTISATPKASETTKEKIVKQPVAKKTDTQGNATKLKHSAAYLNELERLKKLPPQQKEENK